MTREQRLAANEALFREVNERLREVAARTGTLDGLEFVCECADDECAERFPVPLPEYEEVRADPRRFLVLPGHRVVAVERLVADRGRYLVVEKEDEAGELAEAHDPRKD